MPPRSKSFGNLIRSLREAKKITLRKFAEMVGVSPTLISKVERDENTTISEETIKKMASILDQDVDILLSLSNKVAEDLKEIVLDEPKAFAAFLRTAKGQPREVIENATKRLIEELKKDGH